MRRDPSTATALPSSTVVLSPHLDDAVLSVGGLIAARVAVGGSVTVLTAMTANEPADPPSPLVAALYRAWQLPPGRVMAARREEDRQAVTLLGAVGEHLGLDDAVFRRAPDGTPFYPTLAALFGTPHRDDAACRRRLGDRLAERLAALAPQEVLAPLAVGRHVDHQLVRQETEALHRRAGTTWQLRFYEDAPYADRFAAVWRATRPLRAWRSTVITVETAAADRKIRAALAYRSQVEPLYGSPEALHRRLLATLRRRRGERLWEHLPTARDRR